MVFNQPPLRRQLSPKMIRRKFLIRLMTAIAMLSSYDRGPALAQDTTGYRTTSTPTMTVSSIFLPYAQFQIPFNVDAAGAQPSAVQLMVSTDGGKTWQQHGRANPGIGTLISVQPRKGSICSQFKLSMHLGLRFPSPNPPMRIKVDTTKPQAAVRADLDHTGNLIVDLRVADDHLDLKSAVLKIRTDRDPQWREVPVTTLSAVSGYYEGQVEVLIPACREVAIVFSINDQAKNTGTASYLFTMPRTANQPSDLQLASSPGRAEANAFGSTSASGLAQGSSPASPQSIPQSSPGAVSWELKGNVAGANASSTNATTNGAQANTFAQQPGAECVEFIDCAAGQSKRWRICCEPTTACRERSTRKLSHYASRFKSERTSSTRQCAGGGIRS